MINVCVVGYGSIGPIHANALTNTEGVVLYGVCDPDADGRKNVLMNLAVTIRRLKSMRIMMRCLRMTIFTVCIYVLLIIFTMT